MARYWRRTYRRRDGTVVRGHWVDGPDGKVSTPSPVNYSQPTSHIQPPHIPNHATPRSRKKTRKIAISITATLAIAAGTVTFTVTRGGSADASDSVSIQASIDLKKAFTDLPALGFAGSGASNSSQNCAQGSTGEVKQFFIEKPCKEYAVTSIKLHRQGIATQAVVSWIVMTTPSLTLQYKNLVDKRYRGNPPGQPEEFNGTCYASGQGDDATWVAQVQPTGHIAVDRQILQAVAPAKLSVSYLEIHCID